MLYVWYVSLICFFVSLAAHLSTFCGVNLQESFPFIFVLHVVVFAVWIPVVLYAARIKREAIAKAKETGEKKVNDLKLVTRNCPAWWRFALVGLFAYGVFNFFSLMQLKEGGGPHVLEDGRKVLSNHGEVIRELTDEEYQQQQMYDVRLFSGFWMLFYGAGVAVSYSALKDRKSSPAA